MEVLKNIGVLFYVVNPYESLFEKPEDLPNPDWITRAVPYLYGSIILESIIYAVSGRKNPPRFTDGINSLTHGVFLLIRNILIKSLTNLPYFYIYEHYKIYALPWDSVWTWLIAMVAIDFCYYWVHRAAHEIGFLWSAHQVHHSSEDYVLSTALRQSVFQEFGAFAFYLPMAFFIPPSHKLVHDQFNLLYQFWIHTELIQDLGPLNYIFNLPRHHMVHHGANRYCLDKNYGGFLIIWDQLFGTFEDLRSDEEIVYGLVDHPQFFDPIKHQLFYYKLLWDKAASMDTWKDSFFAFIKGPGWFPGTPWTGDMSCVPEVPNRKKYDPQISFGSKVYIFTHFNVTIYILEAFSRVDQSLSQSTFTGIIFLLIASLTSFGYICDKKPNAWILEALRCLLFLTGYNVFGGRNDEGVLSFCPIPRILVNALFIISIATSGLQYASSRMEKKRYNKHQFTKKI
uniref:Alkylglycerol monooxygenase n=1 Tax=Caligus clemensi TaxID=344056 RepID=C1C0M2_CALCM|nr:Transmembrane protein 195 [Caligus clemensi]